MKHFIRTITVIAVALFSLTLNGQNTNTKNQKDGEILFTTDLHCENCVKKIEAALPFVKGVKDMKISLKDKTIWIKYSKSKTNEAILAKAIEEIGYKVEVVKEQAK